MKKEAKALLRKLKGEYEEVGAYQYCNIVFRGKYETAKKTKQACLRFLRILDSQTEDSKFKFNKEEARKIDAFSRMVKLRKEVNYFNPALYQLFILQQLAWLDEDSKRLYQRFYISMGRKQGKSYLVAIMIVYDFVMGNNPSRNKEIMLTSRSENQAKIIYNMVSDIIKGFIESDAKIDGKYMRDVIQVKKGTIENVITGSKINFYSSDADGIDGSEPDIGIMDEYAMMKNGRELRGAIETGQNFVSNPLLVMLSTVSDDLNSDMYKEYGLVTEILDGDFEDDRYFIYIAELEDKEEFKDVTMWTKANPLLIQDEIREGAIERIKTKMDSDLQKGYSLDYILTKTFNMWGKNSSKRYLDYGLWEDSVLEEYDREGKQVYIGLDLSERSDLTGIGFVFVERGYLYVDSHAFVAGRKGDKGEDYLKQKGNSDEFDYIDAVEEGDISLSKNLIGYKEVWEYIVDYIEDYELDVKGIYFDPKFASKFFSYTPKEITEGGIDIIYLRQGFDELTLPISEFRDNLIDGRIKHSNNSFLNYCVKNAVIDERTYGMKINKPSQGLRIDSLDAVINAYSDLVDYNFEDKLESEYDRFLTSIYNKEYGFGNG